MEKEAHIVRTQPPPTAAERATDIYQRPVLTGCYRGQPGLHRPARPTTLAALAQTWREWLLIGLCIVACLGVMLSLPYWQQWLGPRDHATGHQLKGE
jgi:hypothetical protein